MLDSKTVSKIEQFVSQKPRSVFEVANHLGVSWRTGDRYIDQIMKDYGSIATRTFREGTRGALKIVYSSDAATFKSSVFQDRLEHELLSFKKKEDFSAFDIYQHVPDSKKQVVVVKSSSETGSDPSNLMSAMKMAERQVLIFSGNLSFINLFDKKMSFVDVLDSLVKRGVSVKIVCRVDLASIANIERVLSLNNKYAKELVEVRHSEQPLRAVVTDSRMAMLKEIKEPTGKINELNKRVFIYYSIQDKEWVEWLSRLFWKMFSNSIGCDKRLSELERLKFKG